MKYKYLLLLLFSLLFFSCEMKKEILGQTDKGQTDDTTVENQDSSLQARNGIHSLQEH